MSLKINDKILILKREMPENRLNTTIFRHKKIDATGFEPATSASRTFGARLFVVLVNAIHDFFV